MKLTLWSHQVVATYVVAWIEIVAFNPSPLHMLVATYVVAWIEIHKTTYNGNTSRCRHLCSGVD